MVPTLNSWSVEAEDVGDVTLIRLIGEAIPLDEKNTEVFSEQLFQLIEERGRCRLMLDFGNVRYIYSGALAKLIGVHKRLQATGGRLVLCNLQPEVEAIFRLTRLNKILAIRARDASPIPEQGVSPLKDGEWKASGASSG